MRRCRPPSRDALQRVLSVVVSRCVASLNEGAAESGTRESSWARRTSARSSATGPSPRERPRSNVCRSAPLRSALPICAKRGKKQSVAVGCAARCVNILGSAAQRVFTARRTASFVCIEDDAQATRAVEPRRVPSAQHVTDCVGHSAVHWPRCGRWGHTLTLVEEGRKVRPSLCTALAPFGPLACRDSLGAIPSQLSLCASRHGRRTTAAPAHAGYQRGSDCRWLDRFCCSAVRMARRAGRCAAACGIQTHANGLEMKVRTLAIAMQCHAPPR